MGFGYPNPIIFYRTKKDIVSFLENDVFVERATRFELATSTLARWRSAK